MFDLSPILLGTGMLIGAVCAGWLIVLGFQRHWLWGLALLIPQLCRVVEIISPPEALATQLSNHALRLVGVLLLLCFLFVGWPATRSPLRWALVSVVVQLAFGVNFVFGKTAISPQLETLMRWEGLQPAQLEQVRELRTRFGYVNQAIATPAATGTAEDFANSASVFHSRLPPPSGNPAEREAAPPGFFYPLERLTNQNPQGVQAVRPGERVALLERLPGDRLRVMTADQAIFDVHRSQVTDDLNVARAAEREDFILHGGKL